MDEQQKDQEWKKIMGVVFPAPKNINSEAFVTRVMSRIEDQPVRRGLLDISWKIPAFVLGGAVAALTFMASPNSGNISTEALLLGDEAEENISQLAFQNNTLKSDDLLAFALEGR